MRLHDHSLHPTAEAWDSKGAGTAAKYRNRATQVAPDPTPDFLTSACASIAPRCPQLWSRMSQTLRCSATHRTLAVRDPCFPVCLRAVRVVILVGLTDPQLAEGRFYCGALPEYPGSHHRLSLSLRYP